MLTLLLVAACGGSDDALLSIPVRGTAPVAVDAFDATLDQAVASGQDWPTEPTGVAVRFAGATARDVLVRLDGEGERPSTLQATVIADGFLDDSVRGERHDLTLTRDDAGTWRVTRAERSHRCWGDRGHTHFSTAPCS